MNAPRWPTAFVAVPRFTAPTELPDSVVAVITLPELCVTPPLVETLRSTVVTGVPAFPIAVSVREIPVALWRLNNVVICRLVATLEPPKSAAVLMPAVGAVDPSVIDPEGAAKVSEPALMEKPRSTVRFVPAVKVSAWPAMFSVLPPPLVNATEMIPVAASDRSVVLPSV